MVAVTDGAPTVPVALVGPAGPVPLRRVVAVAAAPSALSHPGSDLVRAVRDLPTADGPVPVDLLVVSADGPAAGAVGLLAGARLDARLPGTALCAADLLGAVDDADDDDDEDDERALAALRAAAAAAGVSGLALHRLGLRAPWPSTAEDDVVAALSELIGFDPEPGVGLLAPAAADDDPDGGPAVLDRAVRRLATVYGLPLLRYRGHEHTALDA
jgi:hypothetical protein